MRPVFVWVSVTSSLLIRVPCRVLGRYVLSLHETGVFHKPWTHLMLDLFLCFFFIRFPLVCIEYVMRKTRALETTTCIYLQDKNVWTDYIEFLSSGSKGDNAIHRGNLYPVHSTLDFPKKFDQSEHDTRIWYHGTAASKACIQPPPPFPPSPGYQIDR